MIENCVFFKGLLFRVRHGGTLLECLHLGMADGDSMVMNQFQPQLHSEFNLNLGYTVRPSLIKKIMNMYSKT